MDVLLLGTNFRHAPLAVRERAVASIGDAAVWAQRVRRESPFVSEILVLATCHRLEVYVASADIAAAERDLRARLAGEGIGLDDAAVVVATGREAVLHVCRVASGLDSMIVGEAEIAGQVRRAATQARAAGTLGPYLEAVVAGALGASGRARSETRIAEGVMSAASASVALATGILGTLADRTLLVIGAGQIGRLVLARAARAPHGRLRIASRSAHHAQQAADECGADALTLKDIPAALESADVVIAAVQSPMSLIDAAQVRAAQQIAPVGPVVPAGASSLRSLLLIDLSVPRVIDEAVGDLPGVRVLTVDDLGDVARRSAERREREIPRVEAIVVDEAARAYRRVSARRARRRG